MSAWQETEFGKIPSNWDYLRIENTDLQIGDGNYSSKYPRASELLAEGIPFISSTDLSNGKISANNLRYISTENHSRLLKGHIKQGDVLIVVRGNGVGQVGLVSEEYEDANLNAQMAYLGRSNRIDGAFLYYLLSKYYLDGVTETVVSGSAQPQITVGSLKQLNLIAPPVDEQKAIAAVLTSLDDKIDLLHRQNKTLEAMATTLFRQWFVGEAQEDWEERPLSSIANFLNGLACQKYPPTNELEKLPVLKIRELSSGISEASDWATSEVKPEYIVEAGDVIFAWSASLMVKVWDGARSVLNQHLFKVTSDEFPKWFYLMWCKHHLAEFIAISASHATTMGHIKRGDLDAAMVSIPSPEELKAMTKQMTPLLDKQISISKQIRSLEKLRDTLLPKLMSGEIRIQNA